MFLNIINSDIFALLALPLLIFFARICDVSIGTIRIIYISKGNRYVAPILGFFEVLIWLMAARQVLITLNGWIPMIAYAAGFSAGTFVGIVINNKVTSGKVILRIITQDDAKNLLLAFEKEDFPITCTHAVTNKGKVNVLFLVIDRRHTNAALKLIKISSPKAYYSVEDVKFASENEMCLPWYKHIRFGSFRKGK
jgi:uncharacterized protein YebE (UPF0316 family)